MKYKIQFSVTFECEVECSPENLQDTICDLSIPEDDQTKYVTDTIELVSVEDENGNTIDA